MKKKHEKCEKELFAEALELDSGERAAYLDEACGNDQELLARIQRLLDAHDAASGFLEQPLGGPASVDLNRIGRFRILRELGRGGQGTVYLAEDEKLHRQVAIKVLPSGFDLPPHHLERFKREAQAASRLDHPGICSVYETGENDGLHYIVMRYVEGESLSKKLAGAKKNRSRFKDGVFEASIAGKNRSSNDKDSSTTESNTSRQDAIMRSVSCIEKAALAVHAAHEVGIVHRDIKPGNIMITLDDDPVILDFGLARLDESGGFDLTRSTDILGTPAYMSPEQIRGDRKRIDRQTDIYSLAATLVECLTLRPPFEAPTLDGLYRAILAEAPEDPRVRNPRIPSDLSVIIQTALAKNPDHRYKTALDFAEELRRVRQHEPILTRRTGPLLRLCRWAQRNPRLAAALGGIIFVLALGFFVSTYQFRKTQLALLENQRNADIWLLPYLEQSAEEELWPAVPSKVGDMENWLEKAKRLHGRLDNHRSNFEMMREDFAGRSDQAYKDEFTRTETFIEQLILFNALIKKIEERMNFAATIEERTINQYQNEWNATIEAVADKDRNPQYDKLKIEPRIGLIPLGQDSESKLFEFAHLQTGEIAVRNPETGKLLITEETGLVFVLIPGGTFHMGAVPPSEMNPVGSPNVDPQAQSDEGPVHEVHVKPFFLSKYEMTQAQWLRFKENNPSYCKPGDFFGGKEVNLLHPVENVSWEDCNQFLFCMNLRLPSEAEWEYACRAGSSTVWWTGNEKESLKGAANLCDLFYHENEGDPTWTYEEWLNDGYTANAPVGSYYPNAFGLHDVHGNVWEWCKDSFSDSYENTPIDGSAFESEDSFGRIIRGGSWGRNTFHCRSALRYGNVPGYRDSYLGLRPAADLQQ